MHPGERLKEERERLGYNQADFAALAGATRKSQFNYESDERSPDVRYLAAIATAGADVQYIVTGVRSAQALSRDEVELLEAFRAAPLAVKAAAIGALQGGTAPALKIKQKVSGAAHQVAAGSVVNQNQGEVHVGGKPGGKRRR